MITLACQDERAGDVVALLRARLRGFRVKPPKLDGVTLAEIDALAELLPQRQIRRGGLGAARAQLPLRRPCRRAVHRPGEGPQSDHALCRAGARRRRRSDHRGRGVHLDQRLSAARQLCERRARLRPLSLAHRPHAERGRGRPSRVDRLDLAGRSRRPRPSSRPSCSAPPASSSDRNARRVHSRRHAGRRSCRPPRARRQCRVFAAQGSRPGRTASRRRRAFGHRSGSFRSGSPITC